MFVVALVSATLLPLGSEPAVFGLVKLNPELFWPAVLVATAGNTIGGAISWWMGYGAERAYEHVTHHKPSSTARCGWLERFGAEGLPAVVGCRSSATRCARWPAGCKLPFWPCVVYMAIGKFARYFDDDGGAAVVLPGRFTRRHSSDRASTAMRTTRPTTS